MFHVKTSEAEAGGNRVAELLYGGALGLLGEPGRGAGAEAKAGAEAEERLEARADECKRGGERQQEESAEAEEAHAYLELRRAPLVVPTVVEEGELGGNEDTRAVLASIKRVKA